MEGDSSGRLRTGGPATAVPSAPFPDPQQRPGRPVSAGDTHPHTIEQAQRCLPPPPNRCHHADHSQPPTEPHMSGAAAVRNGGVGGAAAGVAGPSVARPGRGTAAFGARRRVWQRGVGAGGVGAREGVGVDGGGAVAVAVQEIVVPGPGTVFAGSRSGAGTKVRSRPGAAEGAARRRRRGAGRRGGGGAGWGVGWAEGGATVVDSLPDESTKNDHLAETAKETLAGLDKPPNGRRVHGTTRPVPTTPKSARKQAAIDKQNNRPEKSSGKQDRKTRQETEARRRNDRARQALIPCGPRRVIGGPVGIARPHELLVVAARRAPRRRPDGPRGLRRPRARRRADANHPATRSRARSAAWPTCPRGMPAGTGVTTIARSSRRQMRYMKPEFG
ncbi:hypothetical protein EHYA_04778 [Embleya hyalina]|uniref:Uncharacterized protein n=1 Tax=Embleya hyalina TaxID=516124 RepID=A0A401YR75_9ACTN|nr:hypothetical protein EHYA_04778 [Embleya hyalina]